MIYLDYAATHRGKPDCVIAAVTEAMQEMGNAGHGSGDAALDAARLVYGVREEIDDFLGGYGPEQVAFTSNVTEALNIAIAGLVRPGDHIITTAADHNSSLRPLYRLSRPWAEDGEIDLSILPADARGVLRCEMLEELSNDRTRIMVVNHASNVTGNVADLSRISAFCKERDILLIVDAAQSAGVLPLSAREMGIDVLCFTGHKGLLGPQGTGGLIVRPEVEIEPLCVGGTGVRTYEERHPRQMPTRLEAGTLNSHGIAGLGAGIRYLREQGLDELRKESLARMWQFYEGVKDLPGVVVYGDFDCEVRTPVVSLNLEGEDPAVVADVLMVDYDIMTRAGGHCAPLMHRALGTGESGCVRFSFSFETTAQEVDAAIEALKEMTA